MLQFQQFTLHVLHTAIWGLLVGLALLLLAGRLRKPKWTGSHMPQTEQDAEEETQGPTTAQKKRENTTKALQHERAVSDVGEARKKMLGVEQESSLLPRPEGARRRRRRNPSKQEGVVEQTPRTAADSSCVDSDRQDGEPVAELPTMENQLRELKKVVFGDEKQSGKRKADEVFDPIALEHTTAQEFLARVPDALFIHHEKQDVLAVSRASLFAAAQDTDNWSYGCVEGFKGTTALTGYQQSGVVDRDLVYVGVQRNGLAIAVDGVMERHALSAVLLESVRSGCRHWDLCPTGKMSRPRIASIAFQINEAIPGEAHPTPDSVRELFVLKKNSTAAAASTLHPLAEAGSPLIPVPNRSAQRAATTNGNSTVVAPNFSRSTERAGTASLTPSTAVGQAVLAVQQTAAAEGRQHRAATAPQSARVETRQISSVVANARAAAQMHEMKTHMAAKIFGSSGRGTAGHQGSRSGGTTRRGGTTPSIRGQTGADVDLWAVGF